MQRLYTVWHQTDLLNIAIAEAHESSIPTHNLNAHEHYTRWAKFVRKFFKKSKEKIFLLKDLKRAILISEYVVEDISDNTEGTS